MALRNTLLIAALIAGLAIIVMIYVRRGFGDLQGQIDDIETVLAAMPPELTSGQLTALPAAWSQPPTTTLVHQPSAPEYSQTGGQVLDDGDDEAWMPDEEYEPYEDPTAESAGDMPEYSLTDEFGVATLSEPGVYESGVVQLTVHPAGAELASDDMVEVIDVESPAAQPGEQETELPEAVHAGDLEIENVDIKEIAPSPEPPRTGDELNMLTLPELKARLKAIQPDMRGIARMKRAEVLDRLRSVPVEEAN